MIANLREAKSQLSKLVQLASGGEEIVITVRGEPTARLTSFRPAEKSIVPNHAEWAAELATLAEEVRVEASKNTTQDFWDGLRQDRY